MSQAEARTAGNAALYLQVAVGYGGRWDIVNAARQMAARCAGGALRPEEITVENFSAALQLGNLPDPDLFIRTGGERRISNFLLWNLAYTELYFCEQLWPDFNAAGFEAALAFFAARERRYGLTEAQGGGAA
jgi:undecaprenyl diphosphate synthase